MAEKLAGSEPESPRRLGSLPSAMAAMGMLVAGEAVASDQKTERAPEAPTVERMVEEYGLRLRDCTTEATQAQKDWLMAEIEEAGIDPAETKKWLRLKKGDTEFVAEVKSVKLDAYSDCKIENTDIVIAALDARIAEATTVFAEHGFRVGETGDGETMLFFNTADGKDIPAAHFQPATEPGEWELDFTPLEEYRDTLVEDIESMEERIRYIWQQIEKGQAIEPKEAAELEIDLEPKPEIRTAAIENQG